MGDHSAKGAQRFGLVLIILLWAAAAAIALALALERYRAAVAGPVGDDFSVYFHSALAVAAGHSPYVVRRYVYPPPIALVLAPFAHRPVVGVWRAWTALEIAALLIGVLAFVGTQARRLPAWQLPVMAAVASITVLHFWPVTVELLLGEADAFVFAALMLCLLGASRTRSGVLLGVVGLLKGWSGAAALSVFQRGVEGRARRLWAALGTGLLVVPLSLAFGWNAGLGGFLRNAVGARSQVHIVSDSVWGAPRLLFSHSGLARPVLVSSVLQHATTVALLVFVVALLLLALRTAGDPVMCQWNVMLCVVLLLPVSHLDYSLYALPLLWLWGARAVTRRDKYSIAMLAVAGAWWLLQTRAWPNTGSAASISSLRYCVVFSINLALCATSTLASWRAAALSAVRPQEGGLEREPAGSQVLARP